MSYQSDTYPLQAVCVYCGSSAGRGDLYAREAEVLGAALADAGLSLVYGGGNIGLMGHVARAVLHKGGFVTGIIPDFLIKPERMLEKVSELIVTADMHERKRLMYEKSDAFIALPGGIGTLEELVEQMSWSQLGQHNKPIVLANFNGFWTPFLDLLTHMRSELFIRPGLDVVIHVIEKTEDIIPELMQIFAQRGSSAREDQAIIEKM